MLGIEVDNKRIFGLDFLRAFAIFCVVHVHGRHLLNDSYLSFLSGVPLPHGVDIFFVISGFLIGTSFFSYADKNGRVDIRKVLRFYGRTALRILPNYIFIMIVYYILVSTDIVNGDINKFPLWRFITFTQNIFTPFYGFYWESWSLSVQWWFYIIFPLLLFIFSKKTDVKKVTPYICLFFIISSFVFRIIVSSHASDGFWWDVWIRKTVTSRLDNIYIGVIAAWIRHYTPSIWKSHSTTYLIIGILLMIVTFVLPRHSGTFYANVIYLSIAPIAIAMWLPYLTNIKSSKTAVGKTLSYFSILSYAMFLINLMVIQIIDKNYSEFFKQIGACGYLIYWFLVVITSYILYIVIEKQFVKIRDRVIKSR